MLRQQGIDKGSCGSVRPCGKGASEVLSTQARERGMEKGREGAMNHLRTGVLEQGREGAKERETK
eukprot:6214776-Pleurochrysis_carterae.AAC.2